MIKLGLAFLISLIVWVIAFSVIESREDVASSKMIKSGFLSKARAIANLWRSPPDILMPPSPIFVFNPFPPRSRIFVTEASLITSRHSLSVALGLTNSKFSFIVPANNCVSCETNPILFLNSS